MSELEALRAYFESHMAMHSAIDAEKFGRAYAKANRARDRLLQLERVTPAYTCVNAGVSVGACKQHCGDTERCWGAVHG